MIERIEQYLLRQNLVQAQDDLTWSVRLTGNWSLLCFVNHQVRYFIKLQHFRPIAPEYETLCCWHEKLPHHVLKPIHLGTVEGMPMYVQQAESHQTMNASMWHRKTEVQESLTQYFRATTSGQRQPYVFEDALIEKHLGYFKYSMQAIKTSLSLTKIKQHGDFTLSNLGLGKNVFIFDWEDYGVSDYPLLDLTSLVMSLHKFNLDDFMRSLDRSKDRLWLESCLSLYPISLPQFIRCLPYSLAVFLSLKEQFGYGDDIIAKTKNALNAALAWNREVTHA